MTDNPYEPPAAALAPSVEPVDPADGEPTDEELRAFVGPRAESYLRAWHGVRSGRSERFPFHWSAFWWSGLWLPYRKLYWQTLAFWTYWFAWSILTTLNAEEVLWPRNPSTEIGWGLYSVVGLAIPFACGFRGHRWYCDRARRKVVEARNRGQSGVGLGGRLGRDGGTSVAAAVGFTLAGLVAFALFCYAAVELGLVEEGP